MVFPLWRGCHDPVARAEAEQQEQSLPMATEERQAMRRREDEHIEAVALFPPTPSSLHEGSSSVLPQKGLGEKKKTKQNNHHDTEGQMPSPFPRAESHQQVVVGQFHCDLFLIYPQCCYQFFHVVEKLERQGNGSLLHKGVGRTSPLLHKVQLLVLEFLLLPSTNLGLSCPKGEIQKKAFGPTTMDPTWPDFSEQLSCLSPSGPEAGQQLSAPG